MKNKKGGIKLTSLALATTLAMKNDTTKSQLLKLDWVYTVYTVETQSIFQKNHYIHVYLIMVWNKCE